MSYTITNTHSKIIINLTTNSSVTGSLYLRTYTNNSNTVRKTYAFVDNRFVINTSDYDVGDVITKFEILQSGNPKLWQTHEGVQVLLNGLETDTTINDDGQFTMNFDETGEYDIQAIYVGNGANKYCATEKKHFAIVEEEVIDDGTPVPQTGKYRLRFVDKTIPTSWEYNDGSRVAIQLTLNNVPVPNRNVQRLFGGNGIYTDTTNSKGIVYIQNGGDENHIPIKAGKWKFGAYYYDEDTRKTIKSPYKEITIKKAVPTITDNYVADNQGNDNTYVKGSKYVAYLKYKDKPIKGVKVDLFVNGKKTVKTTSSTGAISFPFVSKGTFELKVVYSGNSVYDKVEKSRKITISE